MNVRYVGPEGQVSYDVGLAIDGSALLEPGRVYDLPADLAKGLVSSSEHWEAVKDYSKLSLEELRDVAREKGIEGFSSMKKDDLLAAVRGEA